MSSTGYNVMKNWKIWCCSIVAAILEIVLVRLCWIMSSSEQITAINLSILILSTAIGWLLAVVATPYDKQEQTRFETYTKAVGVFISGFALAKLDRVIDLLISPDNLNNPLSVFRWMAFTSGLIIAFIIVFSFRQYTRIDEDTPQQN